MAEITKQMCYGIIREAERGNRYPLTVNELSQLAFRARRDIETQAQPPALAEDAARFLLVAMDDDGCGNPTFCRDEAAVRDALLPLLFFVPPGETLSEDHQEQFEANLAVLLEDGFLNFEGDPGITLYRLRAARQPAAEIGKSL
jgi:hypothetical protein